MEAQVLPTGGPAGSLHTHTHPPPPRVEPVRAGGVFQERPKGTSAEVTFPAPCLWLCVLGTWLRLGTAGISVDFSLLCISTSYTVPSQGAGCSLGSVLPLTEAWSGVFQQREALCPSLPIAITLICCFFRAEEGGLYDEMLLRSQWYPPASLSYS